MVLLDPRLEGDTIRGFAETSGRPSLLLADVQSLAVKKTSWPRTLGLVAAVGGGVALAALLSNCSDVRSYC
jgi:hypothetical protein